MQRLSGKVAVITGAARGQGRSPCHSPGRRGRRHHGADICADIETNQYPLATRADLEETVKLVEKSGRRAVSAVVDVRDRVSLKKTIDEAVAELGGLHVVVANAGICPLGNHVPSRAFLDAFDVDFVGVINTIHASFQHLHSGASIIVTVFVAVWSSRKIWPPGVPSSRRRRLRASEEDAGPVHQGAGFDASTDRSRSTSCTRPT